MPDPPLTKGLFTLNVSSSVSVNAWKEFFDLYLYHSHQASALMLEIEFQTNSKVLTLASTLTLKLGMNWAPSVNVNAATTL